MRASTTSQSGSERKSRSTARATALWPGASSTTISFRFAAGANAAVSTPSGNRLVVAGEPLGRALDRAGGRAEERVDAGEELRALVLARRNGDPLGGEERGGRRRLGLEQRCRGEAREAGLESVHDVERADREGGREVGADAHRQGHALRQGGGDGGADRDDVTDRASLEGAAALEQVGGTRRGGDDGDEVAAPAQRLRRTAHVLVDVVRL